MTSGELIINQSGSKLYCLLLRKSCYSFTNEVGSYVVYYFFVLLFQDMADIVRRWKFKIK